MDFYYYYYIERKVENKSLGLINLWYVSRTLAIENYFRFHETRTECFYV